MSSGADIYGQVMAVALNFFFSVSPASTDVLFAANVLDDTSTIFCCCCDFSDVDTRPGWLGLMLRDELDVTTLESPQLVETEFDSDTADCSKLRLFCICMHTRSFEEDTEPVFLLPLSLITLRSMLTTDTGGFNLSCAAPRDELDPILPDPDSPGLDCREFALNIKQSTVTSKKFPKINDWSSIRCT